MHQFITFNVCGMQLNKNIFITIKYIEYFVVLMHMVVLPACLSVAIHRVGQKRTTEPWELELQMVISCQVGTRI